MEPLALISDDYIATKVENKSMEGSIEIEDPKPVAKNNWNQKFLTRVFESARYRDFRLLWIAQMTNSSAFWVQMVALPILVLEVTEGSAIHLGLVMGIRTLPAIILGIFAGAIADIWNRKLILIITRLFVTVNAIWFAIAISSNLLELWHIYVFALARGASMVFDQPARRAMIPNLVPPDLMTNAMALNSGSVQLMRVFSAAVAGILIATFGILSAFYLMSILYIVGIPLLILIKAPDQERSGYTGPVAVAKNMKEGLVFAWRTPDIKGALIIAAIYFTFGASFIQVFIPLVTKGPLGLNDSGLGTMYAILGVGGILSTVFIAYINPSKRRGVILLVSLAIMGILMTFYSSASYFSTAIIAFSVVFFVGVAQSAFIPLFTALLAESAPDKMRGRIMSLLAYDQALMSLGAAFAGFSAAIFGTQLALFGFSILSLSSALILTFLLPTLRRID